MGNTSWFLGQQKKWNNDKQGRISCYISQQAMIEGMLENQNYSNCKGSQSPYRSGLKIDCMESTIMYINHRKKSW